ncbi:MAG: hypothetical protein HC896_05805 [Bacteroidales bacterium]|nr:hypothetical protein [Bacteroidales bacterium]
MQLFKSYGALLANDHSLSYGYSVMGWLNTWFGFEHNKNLVTLAGMIIFLIPMVKVSQYKHFHFKLLALASILVWVVIFNHRAESPTFIIAMVGVSLWFIKAEKNLLNIILFIASCILTMLSPTDIFPSQLRNEFVNPYALKAFPCILIWIKIVYDMLFLQGSKTPAALKSI